MHPAGSIRMIERMFDHERTAGTSGTTGTGGTTGPGPADLDYGALVHELRCHRTERIAAIRAEAVREQRRWRLRELAATRVLDERGALDDSLAQTDGVSVRTVRETVATARALEDLPAIAAVAADGRLSGAQLTEVVKVAAPGDEHVWATEAPAWSPADLAQRAREQHAPTLEEAEARRAARELRWWWNRRTGMLDGRFSLPDIDGALVETVLVELVERMRPTEGRPWDSREHRGADALVELCRIARDHDPHAQTIGYRAHFLVHVPAEGPAQVGGVPLPDAMVARRTAVRRRRWWSPARAGPRPAAGRVESALSEKTKRVVRQRDGHCRWPGCDRRHGVQVHHLWPASWGGPDTIANLATVCVEHHTKLAPQGRRLLVGNPNHPAGLRLVDRDDLPALAALGADPTSATRTSAPARAGPE